KWLLPAELRNVSERNLRAIDISAGIDRDAFGHVLFIRFRTDPWNHLAHDAVLDAADADAAPHAGIYLRARGVVGYIDRVAGIDIDRGRPPEVFPLLDEVAVLVEDLDPVVAAIAHEDASARIHRNGMQFGKLAGCGALVAPCPDERAVARE